MYFRTRTGTAGGNFLFDDGSVAFSGGHVYDALSATMQLGQDTGTLIPREFSR